jgi:hypothetical protein
MAPPFVDAIAFFDAIGAFVNTAGLRKLNTKTSTTSGLGRMYMF